MGWFVGALALAALLIAFDWNWLRPSLEHYLFSKSHRTVRIGDLHVSVGPGWQPTVRLRRVFIENAAWASPRPMAVIGEAAFTFDPATLFDDIKVVTQLRLVDAEVSMERQADGLRNWRLTRPDDRGPGRLRVQRLEAHRTHILFHDKVFDLDIDAASTPIDAPEMAGGVALSNRVTFSGRWHDATFKADLAAADMLTLRDTGELFPWRGRLTSNDAQLEVEGRTGDIFRQVAIESHVRLRGESVAGLRPWVRTAMPSTPPYRLDAQLSKDGTHATLTNIVVQAGRSDLAGRFSLERANGRITLGADLQSRRLDVDEFDWAPARAASKAALASTFARAGGGASSASASSSPRAVRTVDTERLRDLDADIALRVARLEGTPVAALQGVQLKAVAKAGVLTLSTLDLGLAGGHVTGSATLDANAATPTLQARFALQHVQLGGLLAERSDKKRVAGFIDGHAEVQTRGGNVDAWLAAATGAARITLNAGSLSKLLDGELGLNGAQIAGAWLTDAEQVPIRCASLALDLRDGRATLRELALDTDKTTLNGSGRIDLRSRSLDLMLTPQSKSAGLLTLRRSIHVSGPLSKPAIKLVDKVNAPVGAACKV